MTENWRPVPGYVGRYAVSDAGRVWSWLSRRYLSLGVGRGGYLIVGLYSADGDRRTHYVAHLVAGAFHGPRPDGLDVLHENGTRDDNRATNLYYGTPSQNQADSVRHGTHRMTSRKVCPRKHRLAEPNLVPSVLRRTGQRVCLACHRARVSCRQDPALEFVAEADRWYRVIVSGEPVSKGRPGRKRWDRCSRGHLNAAPNIRTDRGSGCRSCHLSRCNGQTARKYGREFDQDAYADAKYRELMPYECDPEWFDVISVGKFGHVVDRLGTWVAEQMSTVTSSPAQNG